MNKTCFLALIISGTVHALLLAYATPPMRQTGHKSAVLAESTQLRLALRPALSSTNRSMPTPGAQVTPENEVKPVLAQALREEGDEGSDVSTSGYYPAKALSRMPQPITNFAAILAAAGEQAARGKVAIRLWISRSGSLDRVSVITSELSQPLEAATVAGFGQMRFIPGEIDGVAVMTWVDVMVEYGDRAESVSPALSRKGEDSGAGPDP